MTIIVDTNILFSACLTPDGRIFEILFNSSNQLNIISSYYAVEELHVHKGKLIQLSKLSAHDMEILLTTVLKQVEFINEAIIDSNHFQNADALTKDVDSKDIAFVALALQTDGILWTGDKKLASHLKNMGFDKVLSTAELYKLLNC